MNVDLETLKVFIDVMHQNSFAAVARMRNVDPSSISRTISSLEERLGVRLFQRTTRNLTATEAGILYFEKISPLVLELEEASLEARKKNSCPKGIIRVTTSLAFGQKILCPLLPDFKKKYPGLNLDIILSDSIVDPIAERIDLSIRLGPRPNTGLIGTKLVPTHYHVCASPSYLESNPDFKTPEDLVHYDCLRMQLAGHRSLWKFRDSNKNIIEVPVSGSIFISNPLAVQAAAIAGAGPALLADIFVNKELASGKLINLFPEYEATAADFDTAAWLLYPSRNHLPTKTRLLIDYLKQKVR